ncbi:MAG: bacterioferritin [Legionella sp.]|nr:bacterioferritin [Legionella sp.]
MKSQFLIDLEEIQKQARHNLHQGAVTSQYALDLDTVYSMLNAALATEIICTLRYKKHYFKAMELGASIASQEFLEHSNQEQEHADTIAERIVQLGGEPDYNPSHIVSRAHANYVDCGTVKEMIRENLIAERIAIDIYRKMVQFIGDADPTTRKIIETILAVEEEHADDLLDLAAEYDLSLEEE